ncbi:hypothetical protein SADUNF_Sadunf10G0129000 [Salix dunnii]|uniref:Uracil-DNA glycosylase n=1 Tax=Salix dunnii TaxID=1413687 RepID=A0A835JW13_9ROSI|nr:hypothetical protein SADUNF_Sadunf10G0129000 [Salix dunnii]
MAASSKTIMNILQPAKRRKLSSSSPSPTDPFNLLNKSPSAKSTSSDLTPDQITRIELNKLRAKSKRNLKLCSQLVSNSKGNTHLHPNRFQLYFPLFFYVVICLFHLNSGSSGHVKLEELLVEDTWREVLPGELEKPYFKNLCKFVESEISNGSVAIYPPQHLIFNALNSTPFNNLKAVIIGQDPYHGPGQAMGLSFSVPQGIKAPSSLVNIFKELKQDLGCSIPSHGNLENWAIQGVLLLNTVLTGKPGMNRVIGGRTMNRDKFSMLACEFDEASVSENVKHEKFRFFCFCSVRNHQANSHSKKGWEHFTDAVIKTISQKKEGVVFLLWGNSAQEKSNLCAEFRGFFQEFSSLNIQSLIKRLFPRLIDQTKHHILKAAHPSGLSANRGFFGCRHFSRTNQLLVQMGISPIEWQL